MEFRAATKGSLKVSKKEERKMKIERKQKQTNSFFLFFVFFIFFSEKKA